MFTKRNKITISCDDCAYIPKHPNAGEIIDNKYQIMHNGLKILKGGYHGAWMEEIIKKLNGHHEPQEEKAFYEVLKKISDNSTMIELGSNWAYYSMWFNKEIKNATNIMLEPDKDKLEVGKINFKNNSMVGTFENAFVGTDTIQGATFVDWDYKTYTLNQACVDDIIDKYNLDFVDIVHSDIQGAEFNMLLGATKSIDKKMIGCFFISTHGEDIHEKCLQYLERKNFNILCEHTETESYSGDGLIVASQKDIDLIQISKRDPAFLEKLFLRMKSFVPIKMLRKRFFAEIRTGHFFR